MVIKDYSFLQETCEIVSKLFRVVITVVDSNYIRIAGTDLYKHEIGKPIINANVFRNVMEKGEALVVSNPRQDPECAACENKDSCMEKASIYAPIHVKNQVWGAIGIMAFSDEQKEELGKMTPAREILTDFFFPAD